MVSRSVLPTDVGITTEERLRCVTAVCVASMVQGGLDDESIRRRVLEIASEVIRALVQNEYQLETHTAIVQRAIEQVLKEMRCVDCAGEVAGAGVSIPSSDLRA